MKMLLSCLVRFLALVSSGAVGNLRSQSSFMSSCWLLAAYKWRIPTSWCRQLDGLLQAIFTLNLTAWPYQVHGGLCFDVPSSSWFRIFAFLLASHSFLWVQARATSDSVQDRALAFLSEHGALRQSNLEFHKLGESQTDVYIIWKLWRRRKSCQGSYRGTIPSSGLWDPQLLPVTICLNFSNDPDLYDNSLKILNLRFGVEIFWSALMKIPNIFEDLLVAKAYGPKREH